MEIMDVYDMPEAEWKQRLDESDEIRDEIAIAFGTGVLPVLERLAHTYPYREVWEMTRNQLRRHPPQKSARAYIPRVVATAVRELGFRPVRVMERSVPSEKPGERGA
jgi:hypothetical protein